MAARVVAFKRALRLNARGRDVIGVKRALARAGYLKWQPKLFTRVYGPFAVRAMKKFQKANGLAATGNYGRATHIRLAKHFDAYGAQMMGLAPKSELSPVRNKIVLAATTLYNRRGTVHYTQSARRMQIVREKLKMRDLATKAHIYEDCSSALTGLYYVAGADDPNGYGFNGFGYTGTLAKNGRPVDLKHAKPGDAVIYGRAWPYHHVAVYLGNKMVWSHGSEGGPYAPVPIDYRPDRAMIRSYLED